MFEPNQTIRLAVIVALVCLSLVGFGNDAAAQQAEGPLVISEFMAVNSSTAADPQDEYDDWIELHNTGDAPIDLGGMYLTDDPDDPTAWQFPAGTSLPAGGYLVIWADGDTADAGLHAGFGLDSDGDEIVLFDTDGTTVIDEVAFGGQRPDISYGRVPGDDGAWGYLLTATPGSANSAAYEGKVADTKFSHDRGFYDAPFSVTIACETPDAEIYYTTDGSMPFSEARQIPAGTLYTGPVLISESTCLRAVAIKSDWVSSNTDAHTYLFLDQVVQRSQGSVTVLGYPSTWFESYAADYGMDPDIYEDPAYGPLLAEAMRAIPTLSIVTDKDNLFSKTNSAESGGIYIYTGHSSTGGQDWERPISAELFDANGVTAFQLECGLRIQGGEGRRPAKCPKHSFSLRFRSEYGAGKLNHELFDASPVTSFDSVQLRGFFNNAWTHWAPDQRQRTQYVRDQWMRDALLDMGQIDAGRGFYVHLYLNGIYWGLYDLQERPVASHYAAYHGGDADNIDAINGGDATDGTTAAWREARTIAASQDWSRIVETIDVDNFIDFMLVNLFAGNVDLKTDGNWRAAGGGADGRPWRFYSWDAEHILESPTQSGTSPASDPTGLYGYLYDIEEFRVRFGDRVHKHLYNGGALTVERNIERWEKRAREIELAVVAESARWGDYRRDVHSYSSGPYYLYTRDDFWTVERQRLIDEYFPRRTEVAQQRFRSMGLYPNIDAPVFHVNGAYQHGGATATGGLLSMVADAGDVYYTFDGSDPRTPGTTGGTGEEMVLVAEDAAKRVLVPSSAVDEAWRGGEDFDDSAWLSGGGGVGYENSTGYEQFIGVDVAQTMYGRNTSCYIRFPFELTVNQLLEAGGLMLKVRYDDGFIAYLNGTEVQRVMFNDSATPTWNSSATGNHSDVDAIYQEIFSLSSYVRSLRLGENILAIHGLNSSTTSSDFMISATLTSTQGGGADTPAGVSSTAVVYSRPLVLGESTQVKARAYNNGTWSALNEATFAVGPVAENLRISEVMYHPASDPNAEYIELTNIGAKTINLNLVTFTNGVEFTFPSTELAPGGYTLVVRDVSAFESVYGDGLAVAGQYEGSLDNAGERLELQDAAGQTITTFRYQDDWHDLTDGQGFSLTVVDPASEVSLDKKSAWRASATAEGSPGFDDSDAAIAPGTVVINELMAYPTDGGDWIELYNAGAETIDLDGWFLSDSDVALTKYEIAGGAILEPDGYLVFTQDDHFGNDADPGCHTPFGLSRDGETVYLHSGADGALTGYRYEETFGACETGVTLGRHRKSTDTFNFVALDTPSPGGFNAGPKIGPVVISEIMYHPASSSDAEYVELLNISDDTVTLIDQTSGVPWRLTDNPDDPSLELLFSVDDPITLAAGQTLLLVKSITAFELVYDVPDDVLVLEWGAGKLDNGGDKIELSKPADNADANGPWVRVDRVVYSDGTHHGDFALGFDPWPTAADGQGQSLTRTERADYGNDPANWQAATPSPGAAN